MIVKFETLWDIAGYLRAVVAFLPLLLAPGFCLAWTIDFLEFRRRSFGERIAWSIVLSFGLTIAAVEIAKCISLAAVCWLSIFCALCFLAIALVEFRKRPHGFDHPTRSSIGVMIVIAWLLFVVAELVDVDIGNRMYMSVTVFDHAVRTAFVDAVLRTGVPPANPLYWPGHAAPMRYYYFWYVLTAAAARLGGATARQAMIASVVWSGFGLASVLSLYCRHFLTPSDSDQTLFRRVGRRWPRYAIALVLLAVTGLDIIPVLAKAMFRWPTDADMDWWSPDQVTTWLASLLWVPHHIAGVVCCLLGFLLVWMSKDLSRKQRMVCALLAGLSFASSFGLSTWVAAAFAMVMLLWMSWVLPWEPESRARLLVLIGAGLVAVLALMPYLSELHHAAGGSSIAGNASGLLRFGVRPIIDADYLRIFPWIKELQQVHPHLENLVAELFILIPGYSLELGFYGLVLVATVLALRRPFRGPGLDEASRTSLVLTAATLFITTFLRSTVIQSNDFGFRSVLIAQFFLLLLAVRWSEGACGTQKGWMRSLMYGTVWLGLVASAYQAIDLRLYLPVEDKLGRTDEKGLAERAFAWRKGFAAMDRHTPGDAVVLYNVTQPSDYFGLAQMMLVGRQIAIAFPDCSAAFGGDPAPCRGVQASVKRLFTPGQAFTAADARAECNQLGVGYLVATRWDGVWFYSADWVWTLPVVADTGDVRIVDCNNSPPG